ncbi:MAG: hypothetical protein JRF38_10865 [Deltaproteobacteria bacterium]|nr:hypothetical protein [Deltaproteobacteria bacterium]
MIIGRLSELLEEIRAARCERAWVVCSRLRVPVVDRGMFKMPWYLWSRGSLAVIATGNF